MILRNIAVLLLGALLPLGGAPALGPSNGVAGTWTFSGAPPFPGLRMMQIGVKAGKATGTLTTEWYGPMPMHDLRIQGKVASFGIQNGNPRLPMKTWMATLQGKHQMQVVGDIWEEHVDLVARRGTARDAARLRFQVQPLPALAKLPSDGLAPTPPMGWSSWNRFAEKIDDPTVRRMADLMVSTGLRDAGYVYVNIDDGWQGQRDARGVLQPNPKFPDMKALAAYVHSQGLKLGLYSSPGPRSCAGFEGSYGHVETDAQTWASWGIDYVKYDLCSGEGIFRTPVELQAAYLAMGQALRRTGRPIVYSLCQYGRDRVGRWGRDVGGHLWRTTGDITDEYATMARLGFDRNGDSADAGPGGWNDPDMLEVGNGGMTPEEYRTHMSLWAISAAPLLMGHDLQAMTPETFALLANPEVIAIDQDPKGIQGRCVRKEGAIEIWSRPLADGSVALALFNRGEVEAAVRFEAADAGLAEFLSLRDVWAHRSWETSTATATLRPHGVLFLRARGPHR